MMNKIIAVAVIATVGLSATSANAKVFNGFALGANAGALLAHSKTKTGKYLINDRVKKSDSSTDHLGMYGIQFLYECSKPNSFYWGLGLDVALYSGKNRTSWEFKDSGKIDHLKYDLTVKTRASNRYLFSNQLDTRLGWNFCDKTIVYGLVGIKFQKIKSSARIDRQINDVFEKDYATFKKTETKPVFVLGAGTAVKVSDKVSMGVEYRYSFEKNKSLIKNKKTYLTQKNSSHAILAKVSYHF